MFDFREKYGQVTRDYLGGREGVLVEPSWSCLQRTASLSPYSRVENGSLRSIESREDRKMGSVGLASPGTTQPAKPPTFTTVPSLFWTVEKPRLGRSETGSEGAFVEKNPEEFPTAGTEQAKNRSPSPRSRLSYNRKHEVSNG